MAAVCARRVTRALAWLLTWVSVCAARQVALYGAPPGGGLWAARVDTGSGAVGRGVRHVTVPDHVRSVSYDVSRQQVLVETSSGQQRQLAYGPTCLRGGPRHLTYLLNNTHIPAFVYEDCWQCTASSFALLDGQIYFILIGDYGIHGDIYKKVEVRVLSPCSECSYLQHKRVAHHELFASIARCSRVVSSVYSRRFPFNEMSDVVFRGGAAMRAVREQRDLVFYFQLFVSRLQDNEVDYSVQLELYRATKNGHVTKLHTSHVDRRFHEWDVRAIASVDYREGLLCWTDTISVQCGEVQGTALQHRQRVLGVAEGFTSGVCRGTDTRNLPIVTGVTISSAGSQRALHFGCFSQTAAQGGAGTVTGRGRRWAGRTVTSLAGARGEPLRAGALAAVESPPAECEEERRRPTLCFPTHVNKPTPPPTVHPEPTAAPENEVKDGDEGESDEDDDVDIDEVYENVGKDYDENDVRGGDGSTGAVQGKGSKGGKGKSGSVPLRITNCVLITAVIVHYVHLSSLL